MTTTRQRGFSIRGQNTYLKCKVYLSNGNNASVCLPCSEFTQDNVDREKLDCNVLIKIVSDEMTLKRNNAEYFEYRSTNVS